MIAIIIKKKQQNTSQNENNNYFSLIFRIFKINKFKMQDIVKKYRYKVYLELISK